MKIRLTLFIGVIITLVACVHDIDDINIVPLSPELSIPVGTFTLKAENLTELGDSIDIREGDQRVLELYYESEVTRTPVFDRLTIPNHSFNESLPFSSFAFSGGIDSQVKISEYNSFTIDNIDLLSPPPDLEELVFKGGTLTIVQSKNFDHNLETTIEFPTLIIDGNPVSIVLNDNSSTNLQLATATLDLTGDSGTDVNTVDFEITAVVTNTGSDTQGTVNVNISFEDMEFSFIKGDFHTYSFDEISETVETELPELDVPENVALTNPIINLIVSNSSGIPFGLDIFELSVIKRDGTDEQITGSFDDDTQIIVEASVPGGATDSEFTIDKNNTDNLVDLLNEIPQGAYFNGKVTANPLPSGTPANGNFVTDSSEIVLNTQLILPIEGYANEYMFSDTVKAKLNIEEDYITLENVNVRLQAENGFPVQISLQLYFLDSIDNNMVLDSLFLTKEEQQLFPSAEVDNTGLVIAPTLESRDVSIDNEKYERIRATGSIRISAFISTPGADETPPKSVRISADNYFTLGLGVSAKAIIDPNEAFND
ncbi:MAG: hypothetical protein ABFS32_04955 [Bacteroidota bacterium]